MIHTSFKYKSRARMAAKDWLSQVNPHPPSKIHWAWVTCVNEYKGQTKIWTFVFFYSEVPKQPRWLFSS